MDSFSVKSFQKKKKKKKKKKHAKLPGLSAPNRNIKSYVFAACVPPQKFSLFLQFFPSFFFSAFNDIASYHASRFTRNGAIKMGKNRKIRL